MTMVHRPKSNLPSSYLDPIAERRENPYMNSPQADAYNAKVKESQTIVVNGKEYKK